MTAKKEIAYEGRFIDFALRGGWEFASRKNLSGIVAILAITDEDRIILCEQYRPAMNQRVIELPAGIVGDLEGQRDESIEEAARRELLEETGYAAEHIRFRLEGVPSSGISDEIITLVQADGLDKQGPGGGDDHEDITTHEVPRSGLLTWLDEQQSNGKLIDLKIYAALWFCENGPPARPRPPAT